MQNNKNKMSSIDILFHELKLIRLRQKSYLYIFIILETICAGLLPLIITFIPKIIIDYLTINTQKNIVFPIITLCSVALLFTITSLFCNKIFEKSFLELRYKEFEEINEKYQKLDYYHLEDSKSIDRFKAGLQALLNNAGFQGVYHNFVKICVYLLSVILFSIIIFRFKPIVALVCILSAFFSIVINNKISKYLTETNISKEKARRQKDYFNDVSCDFSYGKEIRILNLSKKINDSYKDKSNKYLNIISDIYHREFLLNLYETFFYLIKDLFAYYFIIVEFFNNNITFGDVSLYIGIIISLSTTLGLLSNEISLLIRNTKSASLYFDFAYDLSLISKRGTLNALPKSETLEIELKNVSFKYPNTQNWIYRNFNLKIKKGEKLAIVGVNGAGKSTLIKIITGLFSVTEGEILINGININKFKQEEYFKMFSVVFQDVHIYACSILENVLGVDTSKESINKGIECLNTLGLKSKIDSLPFKYNTSLLKIIDDTGIELSGGQNQKIAICRSLYKNSNIIILDEPTASLDALAESEIYESFNKLTNKKTSIYISHRLSSTKFCDKIALISGNKISEYGSHDELMNLKGEYYKMFKTQGRYYQEDIQNE